MKVKELINSHNINNVETGLKLLGFDYMYESDNTVTFKIKNQNDVSLIIPYFEKDFINILNDTCLQDNALIIVHEILPNSITIT